MGERTTHEERPLREHNELRITWWANLQYPMRFQGSPDPELFYDDNKGGSRVLIKDAMAEVLDDAELSACDSALVYLFERWPALSAEERQACRYTLLNPNNAGGMVELERLEEVGKKRDPDAAEVARYARSAIRKVLNLLSGTGAAEALERVAGIRIPEELVEGGAVRLRVVEDLRYRSKREEYEAGVRKTAEDSYRAICREVDEVLAREPGIGVEEAKRRVKAARIERGLPTSIWKIEEARRFCGMERELGRKITLEDFANPRLRGLL
jgi:hypothetical protein